MRILLTRDELLARGLTQEGLLSSSAGLSDDFALIGPHSAIPSGLDPAKCVCLANGLRDDEVVARAISPGFRHVVQDVEELRIAFLMLRGFEDFFRAPLPSILGESGGGSFSHRFRLSGEKDEALLQVRRFLDATKGTQFVADSVVRIVDELFMNAVFDAPTDAAGRFRNLGVPRSSKVELAPEEAATLLVGGSSRWLTVGCVDPFGSLVPPELIRRIHRCCSGEIASVMETPSPGAGIGCHGMYMMSTSFLVCVEPGRRTAVFCKLPLGKSYKASELLPKNIHIGSPSPGTPN